MVVLSVRGGWSGSEIIHKDNESCLNVTPSHHASTAAPYATLNTAAIWQLFAHSWNSLIDRRNLIVLCLQFFMNQGKMIYHLLILNLLCNYYAYLI